MASYIPPPNNNTIFNPSDFSSVNDSSLTLDTAEKLFIQKAGDTVTGNITFTQPLTCNSSISCAGVTDTSSLSCQALTCTSVIDTGALSCSGITDTGTLSCTTLSCSGITDTGTLSCTTLSCSGITDTGTLSCSGNVVMDGSLYVASSTTSNGLYIGSSGGSSIDPGVMKIYKASVNTNIDVNGAIFFRESGRGNILSLGSSNNNTWQNAIFYGNVSSSGYLAVTGSTSTPITGAPAQGAYMGWNYLVNGRTNFMNSRGTGLGGFEWYDVPSGNTTAQNPIMTLDSSGNLTCSALNCSSETDTGTLTANGLISANGGMVIGNGTLQINSGSGLVGITHYRTGGFNASNIVNRLVYYQTSITNSGTAVSIPVTTISGNSNNDHNYGFYTVVAYTTTTNNSSFGQNVYFPNSPYWSTGGGGIGFGTVPAINFSGSSISVTGINGTTVNVWIRVELFQ